MAASIYATPPPDLSSEDTALSDASNTSSATNNATATATSPLKRLTSPKATAAAAATTTTTTTTTLTNTTNKNTSCVETSLTSIISLSSSSSSSSLSSSSSSSTSSSSVTTTIFANNNNDNKKQLKRTLSDACKEASNYNNTITISNSTQCPSFNPPNMGSSTNVDRNNENTDNEDNKQQQQNATATTMAAVAAAASAAMQLQLLEAINDAAKKRRKQHNPSRMDDDITTINPSKSPTPTVDFEDRLSKMFLPKSMEQLKETFEYLQQQQNSENISKTQELNDNNKMTKLSDMEEQENQQQQTHEQAFNNPYHIFCKECGENFENEFKLSVHTLQEHSDSCDNFATSETKGSDLNPLDILASVKVKLERTECESPSSNHNLEQRNISAHNQSQLNNNTSSTDLLTSSKDQEQQQQQQQQWIGAPAMASMGFPFPPEAAAAAALQAGGYLPLLGVPGFPGVDGISRPPLRIFNPEAFCELCNKEFCNKYFLKTHKANKHGIYDPSTDGLSSSQQQPQSSMNAINQMFQLQMQQQHQQLQQQQHQMQIELAQQKLISENQRKDNENPSAALTSPSNATAKASHSSNNAQAQVTPPAPPSVFCDICSKRFTNVFGMRRHRAKVHEQNTNTNSQRNSPSETSGNSVESTVVSSHTHDTVAGRQFQLPEGFRQDFVLEQEEVAFTPQPRKLSPQSQQQAREANFAHDKLKRLGVVNPEAFCEICCKEYCNKYFLRTHKWKRHGIFMPPEEADNSQKLPPWPFLNMPSMPVNLMMAQRMMSATETKTGDISEQSSKRIKLEQPDDGELVKDANNDENQENRSENSQVLSVPSTPEPSKFINNSQNVVQSPEAAVGLQNLQKLQTMIQQLNDLNNKRPTVCHLCGRELENQYALQAHIMAEHNGGIETSVPAINFPSQFFMQQQSLLKQSPSESPSSLMPLMAVTGSGELRCTPCEKEFSNLSEFQKHIAEVHLLTNTSVSPLREGFVTPERPINPSLSQNTRPPYTITPTSSYCEICNKELCNKYFMKTHMQRMHGIEIENGAQIGGVVCNICNKELCSKYFLRVHKHNTHGIIEDGAPLPTPRQNGLNMESLQQQVVESEGPNRNLNISPFGSGGSEGKNETYQTSSYTEACSICTRRFRNIKWLRNHLINEHGPSGMEKVRELEQQYEGSLSKPSSPILNVPNGSSLAGSSVIPNAVPSPAQLAQALQNLNAQHLLQNMPKNNTASAFNSEQNLQSPQFKEYQCSMCSFTTPYYAFLYIHERTHSIINNNDREQEKDQFNAHLPKRDNYEELKEKPEHLATANKCLKQQTIPDLEAPTEIVTLDHEDFEDFVEIKQHSNTSPKLLTNEPSNLSMHIPSPTESTSRENIAKPNSPITLLPEGNTMKNSNDFRNSSLPSKTFRSTACSPFFHLHHQLLQEIAQESCKPASFAVPQRKDALPAHMQAFILEAFDPSGESDVSNLFIPAIVYLPVKERVTGTKKLSFNLTPV